MLKVAFRILFIALILLGSFFCGREPILPLPPEVKVIVLGSPGLPSPLIFTPAPKRIVIYVDRPTPNPLESHRPVSPAPSPLEVSVELPSSDDPNIVPEITVEKSGEEILNLKPFLDINPRDYSEAVGLELNIPIDKGTISFSASTQLDGTEQKYFLTLKKAF